MSDVESRRGASPPPAAVRALVNLRLFGLERARLDVALSLLVVALVAASRIAAFPGSVWEQDEAYFAAAVVEIDVADNHPHPPWFPLWITAGRLLHHGAGLEPTTSLQLISAILGVWILFPLSELLSVMLRRPEAVFASLLFLATPLAWWLSGRAFTGTAATALLVLALAWWVGRPASPVSGAVAAALAVLIRPHLLLVVLAVMVVAACRDRDRRPWWRSMAVITAALVLGAMVWTLMAGGPAVLTGALADHWQYHFGSLGEAELGLRESGLTRGLGSPWLAGLWIIAAVAGLARRPRSDEARRARVLILVALAAVLGITLLLSNPAHARYYIPVLALSSAFVVAGLGRLAPFAVPLALVASSVWVVPQLEPYRRAMSPPLLALRQASWEAHQKGGVLIFDHTLQSFVDLEKARGRLPVPAVADELITLGGTAPPPPAFTVAVFDRGHDQLLISSSEQRTFGCSIPLARRLAQDRFVDVTVAVGARLDNPRGVTTPFVVTD